MRAGGKTNVCKVSRGVPVEQERMVSPRVGFSCMLCLGSKCDCSSQVSQCFLGIHVRFLRHELDHNGRNTLSTMMLKPSRSRSNNEGMGSPTAASRLVEVVPNARG